MIVEPDFPDHWKTQLLIQLTGDPAAPMMVIRLWAHCQQRKAWHFTAADMPDAALAAVCRWKGVPAELRQHLLAARFLDEAVENGAPGVAVHQWDDVNATLVRNWRNGALSGGRPRTHAQPTGNPTTTQQKAIGEDREDGKGLEGIGGEKNSPLSPPGKRRRLKKARVGSLTAEAAEEPKRSRMLALNVVVRREPGDPWNENELAALEGSGLLALLELDFIESCETVRTFYHASIPREMERKFWKRTTLATLLQNWGGELDKAREWRRASDDGVKRS